MFGWGVGFYGPGVYLAALHRVHGWSISTISLAITAHFLVSAVLITALPDAYRRFGVASVTIAGAVLAGGRRRCLDQRARRSGCSCRRCC